MHSIKKNQIATAADCVKKLKPIIDKAISNLITTAPAQLSAKVKLCIQTTALAIRKELQGFRDQLAKLDAIPYALPVQPAEVSLQNVQL